MNCEDSSAGKCDAADNTSIIEMYRLAGNSMKPFLKKSILIIKKVPPKMLHIGDIIVYNDSRGIKIVHRIVKKIKLEDGGFLFQTMGDANNFLDVAVRYEDIVGKVYFTKRINRYRQYVIYKLDTFCKCKLGYLWAKFNYCWGKIYHLLRELKKLFANLN